MTFCIGINVAGGLIALADTKIVKGEEQLTKSKLSSTAVQGHPWWIMTSGLRSARDKAVTYLEVELGQGGKDVQYLFELANEFGVQLRRVRAEDGEALAESNLTFNLHAILGGRMAGDARPKMYYIYPEGNWIESTPDAPYFIIGRTHYAKPILDRLLTGDTPLNAAIALAFLAFDATRASTTDVGYPIDVIVSDAVTHHTNQHRFTAADLAPVSRWWHQTLAAALDDFPREVFAPLLRFPATPQVEPGP